MVVRDKHLFSDTSGTPAVLAVDRCWHEREWNQEPFLRTRDSGNVGWRPGRAQASHERSFLRTPFRPDLDARSVRMNP